MLVTKLGPPVIIFHAEPAAVVVPPSAPTLTTLTPAVEQLVLTWTAPTDRGGAPVTAYRVYRGVTSGGETLRHTVGNVLTYTDAAEQNRTYFYKVSAVNSAGESTLSNELSGVPLIVPFVLTSTSPATVTLAPASPVSLRFGPEPGTIAPAWRPDTEYVTGQFVHPAPPNGHVYQSWVNLGTSGSDQPDFPTDGSTVDDGGVTWKDLGALSLTPTVWQPETPYSDGALVTPPTPNSHVYVVYPQYPGTSGVWPHAGQADPWTAPYVGTDDNPAGSDWPTGGPADQGYSGLDGEVYWQDLGVSPFLTMEPA